MKWAERMGRFTSMSDIFISYAREDRACAEALAAALAARGCSVWWDSQLRAGEVFDDVIEAELQGVDCVIVLWSRHSVRSPWVRAEAGVGLERAVLFPIRLDESPVPMLFRQLHTVEVSTDDKVAALDAIARDVAERAAAGGTKTEAAHGPILQLGSESRDAQLASELIARAHELRRQALALRKPGQYWWYALEHGGGRDLLEASVLLTLEARRRAPDVENEMAMRAGLGLLCPALSQHRLKPMLDGIAVGADARFLAGAQGSQVRVLDAADGRELVCFAHPGASAVAFSADGRSIATAGEGGVRLWELQDGRMIAQLEHAGAVASVAFSADGRWIASTTGDRTSDREDGRQVRVWEPATAGPPRIVDSPGAVAAIALGPDGQLLAVATRDEIRVHDMSGGNPAKPQACFSGTGPLTFTPDGAHLAGACGADACVWCVAGGKAVCVAPHQDRITAVAFSRDSALLGVGSQDRSASVWLWRERREEARPPMTDLVRGIGFGLDGRTLVAVCQDGTLTSSLAYPVDAAMEAPARLTRNLTVDEWRRYIGNEPYRRTCPELP